MAEQLSRVLELVVGEPARLRVRAWDGSVAGPDGAPLLDVRSRDAVRHLAHAPNELGLARAYISGSLGLEGDVYAALAALPLDEPAGISRPFIPLQRVELAALVARVGGLGKAPAPPPEEAALSGRLHSRSRDRAAVTHHYDVGNEFYRLVLGESMVYSCAYWRRPDDPAYSLEDAQRDKLDLVCRKLGLHERTGKVRLLDVGCGWGSLLLHAASAYGVRGVGITLSEPQAELARERLDLAGLGDRVDIRVQDYRDLDDGPFDVISSIGMAEHVGQDAYAAYARRLFSLLRPGGRLLNHQISRRPGPTRDGRSFVAAYVFPDGELLPVATTTGLLEGAGFEVRDVESLREHYALTLRRWVSNLDSGWDRAVALTSEGRARVWQLYMAGSALAFEAGRIGVNQVLAVRPGVDGASGMPPTRDGWYE